MTTSALDLTHGPETLHRDREHLVAGAAPPALGKNLDLLDAAIAGSLDHAADGGKIDDAVAHHAAVVEHVTGRHQPVADMVADDALAGARDLARQVRVPPDVIGVDRDAETLAQLVA